MACFPARSRDLWCAAEYSGAPIEPSHGECEGRGGEARGGGPDLRGLIGLGDRAGEGAQPRGSGEAWREP